MENFLAKFRGGEVNCTELGRAMHLCYQNACSLVEDATILAKSSPGRALSLAIIALEEIAKIFLLCEAAADAYQKPIEWSEVSSKFLSHKRKQEVFAMYGKTILEKLGKGYEMEFPFGLPPLLDKLKQLGLYVDHFDDGFVDPLWFGNANISWVHWAIALAKERLDSISGLHSTEEASIALAQRVGFLKQGLMSAKSEDDVKAFVTGTFQEFLRADSMKIDHSRARKFKKLLSKYINSCTSQVMRLLRRNRSNTADLPDSIIMPK